MSDHDEVGLKTYWMIWGVLLAITLVMLFLDQAPLPGPLFVAVMVVAMLTKAALIAGWFMHLKFERIALPLAVVVGLLLNGVILYALIVPDAYRIFAMIAGR